MISTHLSKRLFDRGPMFAAPLCRSQCLRPMLPGTRVVRPMCLPRPRFVVLKALPRRLGAVPVKRLFPQGLMARAIPTLPMKATPKNGTFMHLLIGSAMTN